MTSTDLLGIIAVLGAAVAMLLALRVYKKFSPSDPEWFRKLAHIGTGLMAASFPWVFSSRTPVLIVCGSSVLLLLGMKHLAPLRRHFSGVLDGVDRESHGEIYFPLSIAILFSLANGQKLVYTIPVLVLTFADTVAALTGEHYGKHGYDGIGGQKSMEGSISFFTAAFFTVHVGLLLFTEIGRAETLLISLDIALVVMLLEAIAWRGLDNIFIPLGVYMLLRMYMEMPLPMLWHRFLVAVFLLIFVTIYRSRTTLQGSAMLAAALVLYASWAIGGWNWLIAPAILLGAYTLFFPDKLFDEDRTHNVFAVISVASSGMAWLFVSHEWRVHGLLFVYTLGYALHLAVLGWTLRCLRRPEENVRGTAPLLVAKCWLLMFLPYVLMQRVTRLSLFQAAIALPACAAAFTVFCLLEPRSQGMYSVSSARWLRQACIAFVLTVLAAGVQGEIWAL
jgi:phytol kinase